MVKERHKKDEYNLDGVDSGQLSQEVVMETKTKSDEGNTIKGQAAFLVCFLSIKKV